jgi:hypothetical protein
MDDRCTAQTFVCGRGELESTANRRNGQNWLVRMGLAGVEKRVRGRRFLTPADGAWAEEFQRERVAKRSGRRRGERAAFRRDDAIR